MKHELFALERLAEGHMVSARAGAIPVLVLRKGDGELRALRDTCPHRAATLSKGVLQPAMIAAAPGGYEIGDSLVVKCPWHGYEFDVESGRCLGAPDGTRVRTFKVWVENGIVCVETG